MKNAFLLKDSILWHDGMMLTAGHFQQLTDRLEGLSAYYSRLRSPYNWGINKMEIDEEILKNGRLVITNIEAVMQDGQVIYDTTQNKNKLELDFLKITETDEPRDYIVYLYLPPKSNNDSSKRYMQVFPEVAENETDQYVDIKIPCIIPNISLKLFNDKLDTKCGFPIAVVNYANGRCNLSNFIPPALTIQPGGELWKIITAILQKIKVKAMFLARQISPSSVHHDPLILDKRILLQNLIAGLPNLEAMLQSENTHPYDLYLSLCSMMGNIFALGFDMLSPNIIKYDHNNLYKVFNDIKSSIFQILDESIGENYHAVPFERDEDEFSIKVNKYWLNNPLIIGIEPKENKEEKDILSWMLNCLIGTDEEIIRLKRERTLGIQRVQIEQDKNFPPSLDKMFFSIDQLRIKPNQVLKILNPSDKQGYCPVEKINLYVRRRSYQ